MVTNKYKKLAVLTLAALTAPTAIAAEKISSLLCLIFIQR